MALHSEPLCNAPDDKKRKMKTPLQLEVLEQVFEEEKYPSEALRARLSIQLGLSNRQLKMWFCHRRLKQRKSKGENEEHGITERSPQQLNEVPSCRNSASLNSPSLAPSRRSEPSPQGDQLRIKSHHLQDELAMKLGRRLNNFEEGDLESFRRKKSRHAIPNSADCLRVAELQAIASVEAQLGEPLRLDSPCLGVEFDPLPAGAFSAPAVPFMQLKPSQKGPIESSNASKPDPWLSKDASLWVKSIKVRKSAVVDHMQVENSRSGTASLQEYQFIPECPTGLTSACEKSANSNRHLLEPSRHGLSVPSLMLRGSESPGKMCKLEQTAVSAGTGLSLKGDACNIMMYPQLQLAPQDSLPGVAFDGHYVGHVNPYSLPAVTSFHDIEKLRTFDRLETSTGLQKQKCEEIRMAREVDAHTKRVQKELEREELSRRKREEQLQKEHEKEIEKMLKEKLREDERLLRDKQREDERLQRERQREDERLQREARRESERQERFLQKEAQRLEREREKEEARRLKEATRLKVAIERATARRIARECVELIDDERLELLEVAATSQGLPSIYLLDGETLQGLDRYKEFLKRFPPSSVKMKKPLRMSPWVDSQRNLGNLFMVWRFLIAFADVLGLWPFTLDELVQAFYDYESRLLAELHIALLKVIVKDVEDMAKASANAGAVNQYTAASTIGGGHLQLVEAAFACGFNYRNWSRHLNASTWPEILRQFALAAGYGGFVEKHQQSARLGEEGRHLHLKGNATASSWRLGITTANAANILKIKSGPHIRKAGSRLTPGTVKFAAFHVLSVEGSHGLLISEIVARIEKYGLRDFSTSKTPESSVAAALSRDTIFFDRVAPSTYCVKTAYRKNPQDAEQLLQAALDRIRLFQSGILDACDEKDTEGSEEGENDSLLARGAEDRPLNDMHRGSNKEKVIFSFKNSSIGSAGEKKLGDQTGFSKPFEWFCENGDSRGKHTSNTSFPHANALVQDGRDRRAQKEKAFFSSIELEVDESHVIEPWVQGLMEGEYSGLSVEERLNALVALVEAVNEGNTIRVALEDRMESATALKRQMWTEAQLDKRRFKEEQVAKSLPLIGGDCAQSEEGTNTSLLIGDVKSLDNLSSRRDVSKSPLNKEQGISDYCYQDSSIIGVSSEKSRAQLKVDIDFRADELYIFRSLPLGLDRRRNRYWQFMTSHASEDPSCGRIFFESSDDGHWEVIDTEEAFNALLANLDTRGVREAHLHGVLMKLENLIRQGMRKLASKGGLEQRLTLHHNEDRVLDLSTVRNFKNCVTEAFTNEEDASSNDGTCLAGRDMSRLTGAMHIQTINNQSDKRGILERYREFDMWLWRIETPNLSFVSATRVKHKRCSELLAICNKCHDFYWHEDKHCAYCHTTFEASLKEDVKYVEHVHRCKKLWSESRSNEKFRCFIKTVPCRVQFLKAQLLHVEAAIPAQALRSSWSKGDCKLWATSLKDASSPSDLLQLLFGLEMAIQRDWLSDWFEPVKEIMHCDKGAAIPCWIPCTTAAVAMRLMDLDSALFYSEEQKQNTSNQRQCIPDLRTVAAKSAQSCDTKTDVLKENDLKPASNNGAVEEARGGYNRAIKFEETRKLKFQRLKQPENMSMKKHGTDIGACTGSLVNLGVDKTCRGSLRDSKKHLSSGNLESEVQKNNSISQKVMKPVPYKSQWTKAHDARASSLCYDRGQNGWTRDQTEEKDIVEDDLEEEEDAPSKEEENLLNQRGCPSKKWVDGSEDYETDSMDEASVDVSVQDDDDYNIGEGDHRHEDDETYSLNYRETYFSDSIDEDGKFRSSDLGSFDETE